MILQKHGQFLRILSLAAACSLLIASCTKDNLTASLTPISGNPPPIIGPVPIPFFLAWSKLADLPLTDQTPGDIPRGRVHPLGFTINGKGFLCGGYAIADNTQAQPMKDLWAYDAASKTWSQKANFPGDFPQGGSNFVIGDNGYVCVNNQTWMYNQPRNVWIQKAALPSTSRGGAIAFAAAGKGYLGLGLDNAGSLGDLTDFWQYDPSADSWLQKASFRGLKRHDAVSFVISDKGYVTTGITATSSGSSYPTDCWQYDPGTNAWTIRASFPAAGRATGVGIGLLGAGYVGTGSSATSFLSDFWQYSAVNNAWSHYPNVGGGGRYGAGAFAIGSNLYVAGGGADLTSDGKKDFWTLHL